MQYSQRRRRSKDGDKEEEKDEAEEEAKAKAEDAMAEVQTTAEIQLQELRQARDRVFQAAIQKEARRVAAMIAAAPPLATSSPDSDVASNGTNLPVLTEEEYQEDREDKEEEAKVEEEKDKAMTEVQTIAEIQLQELRQARDRLFQAFIQEARRAAAMIAAAPPLTTSSPGLITDTSPSGPNPPGDVTENSDRSEAAGMQHEADLRERETKKEEQTEVQDATKQPRDQVFQALVQEEARMVAALSTAAPPMFSPPQSVLIDDSAAAPSGTNPPELEIGEDVKEEKDEAEDKKGGGGRD